MDRLGEKINEAVTESECDAIMATGVDNFNYLTQIVLPFATYYPERGVSAIIKEDDISVVCPLDWVQPLLDQGFDGEIEAYNEHVGYPWNGLIDAVEDRFSELDLDESIIGIDATRTPKGLMIALEEGVPRVEWRQIDPILKDLRILKTPEEVELIETACKQADKGIIFALNHLEGAVETPGYSIAEFSERVRVHIYESGASGVGLLSTTTGPDAQLYYAPQREWFDEGELFRTDVSCHYMGYWAYVGRMGVTGQPTPEQESAYRENRVLKSAAEEMLKPGVACNEVYAKVSRTAEREVIDFWKGLGVGHGVGITHHEPPFLNLGTSTELKPGMVIALDIYTYAPRRELIHDKDVYLITEAGNRKLSWYRDWEELYSVTGFRATH
ncbi:MAG: M24 family metallopeptidase [Candidatus Bathyarchaeia archaeon]